jgi:hypothetical protein
MTTVGKVYYYCLGMLLDETGKPSMARWMLAIWMWLGWLMVRHELHLKQSDPSLQNPVWTAWTYAAGFLAVAVFGPRVASYFGAGAAGSVTGIAASIRDQIVPALAKVDAKVDAMISAPAPASTQVNVNQPAAPMPAAESVVP